MTDGVTVGVHGVPWTPTATSVGRGQDRPERGAVTAEAAMVLPLLVAIALGLVWILSLAATQVRVVDGAREVARQAARGESDGTATEHGRRVSPEGVRFTISRGGEAVRVTAVAQVEGPGGLFGFLPGVDVRSEAVAAAEPR